MPAAPESTGGAAARALLGTALVAVLSAGARSAPQTCNDVPGSAGLVALDDLGTGSYAPAACVGAPPPCQVTGGLYQFGSSCVPAEHGLTLASLADQVAPLPGGTGPKVVMLGLGMSNGAQLFGTFERLADRAGFASGEPHHPELLLVNGAEGAVYAQDMADPGHPVWASIEARLAAVGATREQVQLVWLHQNLGMPTQPAGFPKTVIEFEQALKKIVQDLTAVHYPNVRLCFLSSRVYGGYGGEVSEPIPFQGAVAVRALVLDQILDPAGNGLAIGTQAPGLLWGPYLWADGSVPRIGEPGCSGAFGGGLASSVGAGLTWLPGDFVVDCVHLSVAGERKGAERMHDFFSAHQATARWFRPDCDVGALIAVAAHADTYVAEDQSTPLGAAATLEVDDGTGSAAERRAFLKFDLTPLGATPVVHAKLSLRNAQGSPPDVDLGVSEVDPGWDEASLVWSSAPPPGVPVGVLPASSSGGSRALEVTAQVNAAIAGGRTELSFELDALGPSPGTVVLLSREAADGAQLILRTAAQDPVSYCTAGTSAGGCTATLSAVGTASASAPSGFTLTAADVEGDRVGQFLFGTSGRQANPWGSGTATSFRCVAPPVVRAGLQVSSGAPGACGGALAQDLNALWCPTCPSPGKNPGPGVLVQAQLWYRSPGNPNSNQSTSLSDALEFSVCP